MQPEGFVRFRSSIGSKPASPNPVFPYPHLYIYASGLQARPAPRSLTGSHPHFVGIPVNEHGAGHTWTPVHAPDGRPTTSPKMLRLSPPSRPSVPADCVGRACGSPEICPRRVRPLGGCGARAPKDLRRSSPCNQTRCGSRSSGSLARLAFGQRL